MESGPLGPLAFNATSQLANHARPTIPAHLTMINESVGSESPPNTDNVPRHAQLSVATPVAESRPGIRDSGGLVATSDGSRPRQSFETTSECGCSLPTLSAMSNNTGSGSGHAHGFAVSGVGSGCVPYTGEWGLHTVANPSQGSRPSFNVWDSPTFPLPPVTDWTSYLHQAPSGLRTAASVPYPGEESRDRQPPATPQLASRPGREPSTVQQHWQPGASHVDEPTGSVPVSQTHWGPCDLLSSSGSGSAVSWSVLPPPPSRFSASNSPPVASRQCATAVAAPSQEVEWMPVSEGFRGVQREVFPSFSNQDISAGAFSYPLWGSDVDSCSHDSDINNHASSSHRGCFAGAAEPASDDDHLTAVEAAAVASYLEMNLPEHSHSLPLPVKLAPAHSMKRSSAPAWPAVHSPAVSSPDLPPRDAAGR